MAQDGRNGTVCASYLPMCAHSGSKTILVVKDNTEIRFIYEQLLEDAGYHVLSAAAGQQARTLAARQSIDGFLLDHRLPDTTGVDLCREFRATFGPRVPIILLTADREGGLESKAFAAGATVFLHKPFKPDVVLTLLAAYLPL